METPTDPPPKDSDDVRLRRFTMGMGIVFVLMTCGKAKLVKEGEATLPIFGNKIILENPEFIYWLIVISTFYALGLFCYRNLYLKTPPLASQRLVEKIWSPDLAV